MTAIPAGGEVGTQTHDVVDQRPAFIDESVEDLVGDQAHRFEAGDGGAVPAG